MAAMPSVVTNTKPIANVLIVLMCVLKSLKAILKAASYNKGGRKIRKTTSGLICISGMVGIKPIPMPAVISRMGYGNLILSAIAERPIMMAIMIMTTE